MVGRYISIVIAAAIAFSCSAHAQGPLSGSRRPLLSSVGVPSWVKPGAAVDLDFANGRAFGCTLASCLSITRASSKTNLLPSSASGFAYSTFGNNVLAITPGAGLLIEEARTNQLLNSAAPATQTTGSLATGTYILWVNGSGSATMSAGTATGCGTGAATNGTPVTVVITIAGTCVVTIAGSLNFEQLELGVFGTSGIVTAGATATRAADNVTVNNPALALLVNAVSGQVLLNLTGTNSTLFPILLSANGGPDLLEVQNSNTGLQFNGSTSNVATFGSGTWAGTAKSVTSWTASSRALVINNGTEATSATTIYNGASQTSFKLGALNGSSRFYDGYVAEMAIWSTPSSAAARKALTQ